MNGAANKYTPLSWICETCKCEGNNIGALESRCCPQCKQPVSATASVLRSETTGLPAWGGDYRGSSFRSSCSTKAEG